jgi:predicted metal-binding membrane protein
MPASANSAAARVAPLRLGLLVAIPVVVALISWGWLAHMIGDMSAIPGMSSMMMSPHTITSGMFFGLFVMWAVMMAAMMLPTAAPMILAYARMQARDRAEGAGWLPVAAFSLGYVIVWSGFSLAAAGFQAVLTSLAMMSPMMMKTAAPVSGAILIGAGLYQFAPLKLACLRLCQSPLSFLMTRWRSGAAGALHMGTSHGTYCVGCCWAMMAVLFAVGVMNTAWIAGLTVVVLLEKTVRSNRMVSRVIGLGLICLGAFVLLGAAGI